MESDFTATNDDIYKTNHHTIVLVTVVLPYLWFPSPALGKHQYLSWLFQQSGATFTIFMPNYYNFSLYYKLC
jgi:hypothetical protein